MGLILANYQYKKARSVSFFLPRLKPSQVFQSAGTFYLSNISKHERVRCHFGNRHRFSKYQGFFPKAKQHMLTILRVLGPDAEGD